ncbi:MAG: fibronectin type III domain-containing protein [Paludibacteraceae bacterium]|nr:fibronectin type III domain-containing protein [Paludibacteraceae bacterium]
MYSSTNNTPTIGGAECSKIVDDDLNAVLSGLECNTTYYVRSYATNEKGTGYSTVKSFKTSACSSYTITWISNNSQHAQTQVIQGDAITTLPTNPSAPSSCSGKVFVGWTAKPSVNADGTGITYITAATVPAEDAIYYAVFATETTSGSGSGEAQLSQTLQYDTWTYSGSTTDKSSYRLFHSDSYIESAEFDLSTLSKVVVYGGTFGGTSFNQLTIGDGTNTWKNVTVSGKSETGANTYTGGTPLSGTGKLRITSKSGTATGSGVRISKVEIYTTGPTTTYSDYVTQCDNNCTPPATPLSITAEATALNLNESSSASTTLSTTGGNGGEVIYSVSPSATISGNTITFNATGTYTVTAAQAKNGNTCAQSDNVEIVVKATPVITLVADPSITLTADCGQKTTATVQVTAYNCGTNDVKITSNNTRITVSPASFTPADGKVKGEITLSYTATQGSGVDNQNAEISAQCGSTAGQNTISVTAKKGNCTPSVLTFMDRGSQYKQINSHYAGQTLQASEVPDPKGVCTQPTNYVFDGWATASVANDATTYTKVNFDTYTITGNQTFYAVYKYAEEGGGDGLYHLVTDVAKLQIGSSIVIAASASNYAISTTQNTNNRGQAAITKDDTEKTLSFENTAGVQELTLKEGTTTGTYAFYTGSGYLYAASSSKNHLKTETTLSANSSWEITITSAGVATCTAQGTNTNNLLQYNSSSSLFSCYGSDQNAIAIYQLSAGTTYYTSSPTCGPYVQIVGSKDIYVTSGNVGGRSTVQAQDTIRFTSGALAGSGTSAPKIKVPAADITINGTPTTIVGVTFVDSICTKNDVDGTYSITGGIVVKYTPTNSNATENIKVKLRAEYNTGKNVVLDSFVVHARSLPEKFVITAKGTDGKWYALPADMYSAGTYAGNGQLEVDKTDNPTKATITPCNTIYKFDGQKQGGDLRYVRFVGLGGKYLWAATTGNTGIKNDAKDPAAADAPYNWLLTSADNVTYTFANQNTDRTLRLSGTNFGMYTSGVNELRILPIVEADTCAYNAAPQNISLLSRTSTTLTLAWSAVPGAERYQFSRNGGTDWYPCNGITDMEHPQYEFKGLSASTEYTIVLRAVHGTTAKICSDTAQITVTTAACDKVPEISGTISDVSSCGTLTLTATGVTATTESNTYCPVTQYGFQYTQDPTWAKYEQTEHSNAPTGTIEDNVTVSRGGTYYVRLYAINGVGTGYSTPVKTITVSGLANLQIITAGDATTAPMISGKATLRIGAVSDSPSPITWQVFDGSNAAQTTIADGIANNGVFSTTAFGVYRVVAKQAANADPTYCADSATIYIEVRLPNHYGYVTNCAVLNNNNLEVINVSKDNITFGIDDADVVQIEIVKENTGNTSTGGGGQAKDLFISKYFEASGEAKVLGVFNGTNQEISLADITLNRGGDAGFSLALFGHTKQGYIMPNEELIFIRYGAAKSWAEPCSKEEESYPQWYWAASSNIVYTGGPSDAGTHKTVGTIANYTTTMSFSGKQTITLRRNGAVIDIVGAVNANGGNGYPTSTTNTTFTEFTSRPSWGDEPGAYCLTGDNIQTDAEETDYGLSLNRCLLVRRNTVTDGTDAVNQNIGGTFNTLCSEWSGLQITKGTEEKAKTCEGMAYVAGFDYADYFQRYEPVTGKIDKVDLVDNGDGSWSLPTSSFEGTAWDGKNFHDLACTSVKINGYQKIGLKDSLITALNYKVPIIVDRTTTTDDAELFGFAGDGRIICPECDVVIRDNKKLSVVPAGYNNIRNMWVYSGAALNIQDDKTYNMGKLTIESENNEVGYALIKGTLNAQDGISHTKRIDANAWYDFSLPYNCKVSDIVRTNGKTLGTYGTDWIIKYYDGQKRAISGTPNGAAPTNWAVVPADGILEAGVGYIVALGGTHNANPNYKVRFVLPNRSTQPYVESVNDNRTKGVKGYTGPKAEELPCHKGWNYLGNPYVSRFDGNLQDPVWQDAYTGLLLNGFYTDLLTGNSYDVIEYPDLYVAVDMGEGGVTNWVQTKASEALLSPFRAFMIQAVSDGDVDFNKEARDIPQGPTLAPSIRSVGAEREIVNAVRLNISHDTYGTGSTDIMLHSLYTDKYDLGYDMVRMFNNRPAAQPFTLNSTADYLLYNAANRELAETSDIPVGIRTLAAGTYTFSLAPLTGTDRYAAIYLIDRDENDLKIDLLQGNYTTMLARETNTSRFALRFEKCAQLPTDIDNDAIQSPIIYRDQTDIVIDNLPTDATVRVVDAIGRTLYMQQADAQIVRFHAPARGAYIIQVMTQQGNFSIKTIL